MTIKGLDGQSITIAVTNMLNKVVLVLLAATIGLIAGEQSAIFNIKQDCGYLEKFRHNKEVYSCKKIH
jgi:hypothetical protein